MLPPVEGGPGHSPADPISRGPIKQQGNPQVASEALQPSRPVHRIADHGEFHPARAADLTHHGGPTGQPDAAGQEGLTLLAPGGIEGLEGLPHRQGTGEGRASLHLDPPSHRRTKHRHHGVTDELVDGAAVGRDHLHHRAQVGVELLHVVLAAARRAALPGEGRKPLQIAEQHRHIEAAPPQHPLGSSGIGQDLGHHPWGHVALEGAAQAPPLPLLPEVGITAKHQGQQGQASRRGQQRQPAMPPLSHHHAAAELGHQGQTHQPQPPGQGGPAQGQQTRGQHRQPRHQGTPSRGRRPGLQAIPLEGIGGGGGQQLQSRKGAEGGGIAIIALGHHGPHQGQGTLEALALGVGTPTGRIQHLPGRQPPETAFGAIGGEFGMGIGLATRKPRHGQQGEG